MKFLQEEEETSTFFVTDEMKGMNVVVHDASVEEEKKEEEEEEEVKKEETKKKITSIADTPELVRLKAKNMLRSMMRKKHDRNQERIEEIYQQLIPIEKEISILKQRKNIIRKKRNEATEKFVEEQISIAKRQHYAAAAIEKLLSKQETKGSIVLPQYTKAIQDLSSSGNSRSTSRYVVSWETKLCQAFHQVEVNMKQLEILSKHRDVTIRRLKRQIRTEHQKKDEIEEKLLSQIKTVSLSMASVIMENSDEFDIPSPPKSSSTIDDSPTCVTDVKQIQRGSWNPFF